MYPQAFDPNNPLLDFSEWETIDGLVECSDGKLTETQIRWQLRFRDQNGLDQATVKVGKRWYIHVPTYMRLIFNPRSGVA